jgi:penicillin-binding protein 2
MSRARDLETQQIFTRRALVLGGTKLALFGALAGKLYYLQVVEAARYRTLSEDNQFNLELLPPIRGRIFDRNGGPLADNRDNFRIEIVAEQTGDVARTLAALRSIIHIEDWDLKRVLREIKRKRSFVPITVVENLSREDISKVAINTPYLPGIRIEVGRSRNYPYGAAAVHLTGYVAAVAESELTGDPVLELPDFRIGKSGIEKFYDREMRGEAGQRQVEVNALGRIIRKLPGNEGQPGQDVALTIDVRLQDLASRRLVQGKSEAISVEDPRAREALASGKAPSIISQTSTGTTVVNLDEDGKIAPPESGAAVLLDVHHGDVLALVSTPGFDPNLFNNGLSPRDWEHLLSNPRSPMTNKSIAGQYSPGSTFKMLVCLAALEAGVVTRDVEVFCSGYMELGNERFHCWKKHGHGKLDMFGALEQSCDIYLYEMAKRVGIDRIAELSRRFGLGEKLKIDLPGESRGLVPSREWKLATRGEPWQHGETLITGIGQGFLLCTPLQMATMTARLVNGGYAVVPRLVHKPDAGETSFETLNVSPSHLEVVLEGMTRVVNGKRGTARAVPLESDEFQFGGKSGSVQVKRISRAERLLGKIKNKDRPWRDRDHALFVAYAPLEAPRFAVSVVVEHGGSGSTMAAPIARDILAEAIRLDPARIANRQRSRKKKN